MTDRKRLFLITAVIIIMALGVWSIILDFSRFIDMDFSYDIHPSALLKRINVIIASVIAWTVGSDGLSRRDSLIMKAVFVFVCLGETFFAIGERINGVYMFAGCQILLTLRNSTGLLRKLSSTSRRQTRVLLLTGMIIFAIPVVVMILFKDLIYSYRSWTVIYTYGILLCISLWVGLSCGILGLLPPKNSYMVAVGMPCFFFCDILVGFDATLDVSFQWLTVNSLIWVFYIPALTLLALSSYRYKQKK